jgi:hypothetical protein
VTKEALIAVGVDAEFADAWAGHTFQDPAKLPIVYDAVANYYSKEKK